jgi:hypothetical protein
MYYRSEMYHNMIHIDLMLYQPCCHKNQQTQGSASGINLHVNVLTPSGSLNREAWIQWCLGALWLGITALIEERQSQ